MNDLNHSTLPLDRQPERPPNFDTMTAAQFEQYLPELFSAGTVINSNPSLQLFLGRNPDCAALVRDLEAIAQAAKDLFPMELAEPSDSVWSKIEKEIGGLGLVQPEAK